MERTLFLRRVTEEALRVTRCGATPVDYVGIFLAVFWAGANDFLPKVSAGLRGCGLYTFSLHVRVKAGCRHPRWTILSRMVPFYDVQFGLGFGTHCAKRLRVPDPGHRKGLKR